MGQSPKQEVLLADLLRLFAGGRYRRHPLKIYFSSADNISTDGKYLLNNSVNENDASVAKNVGFSLAETGSSTPIQLNVPYVTDIMGDKAAPDSETLTLDAYYYKTNAEAAKWAL